MLISPGSLYNKAEILAKLYIDNSEEHITYNNLRLLIFHCFLASVVYLSILSFNHKRRREIIEYLNVLAKAGENFVIALSSKLMKLHNPISKKDLIALLKSDKYQYLLNSSTFRKEMLSTIMRN